MPDAATGQTNQCLVNVIKMTLDVNHDGNTDLSFAGPDNTSPAQPFQFWLNNNFDRLKYDYDDSTNYEDDVLAAGIPYYPSLTTPDSGYMTYSSGTGWTQAIPTMRDLQDYTRLWCGGVSNILAALPTGSTAKLYWNYGTGGGIPTINLFKAADTNGGMQYLTNATVAALQTNATASPFAGTLGPGNTYYGTPLQFGNASSSNPWPGDYFIFCGAGAGNGYLTLDICDPNGNVLVEEGQYINIQDIKQMYERWTVGDSPTVAPMDTAKLAEEGLAAPFHYAPPIGTNTPYILYVHGWNMEPWEKDRFAESAFKRLYWQSAGTLWLVPLAHRQQFWRYWERKQKQSCERSTEFRPKRVQFVEVRTRPTEFVDKPECAIYGQRISHGAQHGQCSRGRSIAFGH